MKSQRNKLATIALVAGSVVCNAFAQRGTLMEGEYLFPGQQLIAPGCYFGTFMQPDGNLVTYGNAQSTPSGATWASGTNGSGGYARLQEDNNFVIYNWNDQAVWATGTNGRGYDQLIQQDDGNLVLYNLFHIPLWASGSYGEALAQSPCVARSVLTRVDLDTDLPGSDYRAFTIPVARHTWCGYYCAQDSKCQAYTYVPPGVQATNAVCWLKNSLPGGRSAPGMVSGYKVVR